MLKELYLGNVNNYLKISSQFAKFDRQLSQLVFSFMKANCITRATSLLLCFLVTEASLKPEKCDTRRWRRRRTELIKSRVGHLQRNGVMIAKAILVEQNSLPR